MKRFASYASIALATLLVVVSNLYAQSSPVYQYFDQLEQFNGSRCESFEDTQNLFGGSFTIAAYVSVANSTTRQPFVAHDVDTDRGFWFGLEETGKLYFQAHENGETFNAIQASSPFPTNQWVYVTLKYNEDAGTIQLEQDGQIIDTKPGVRAIRQNDEPVKLGCYFGHSTNSEFHYYLTGKMQGVRFYPGADLNLALPTPDGSAVNPTPDEPGPDPDGTPTPEPTEDPSQSGGEDPPTGGSDTETQYDFYTDDSKVFDGNTCEDIPNDANLFANNFTINTQVMLTTEQERHIIISQEVEGDRGMVFDIEDGKPGLQIYYTTVDETYIQGNQVIPQNEWVELTATLKDGVATIEMNGVEVAREANVTPMRETSAPTRIGCYHYNDLNRWYLEGQLRNLRLFDMATTIVPSITPTPTPTPDPNATETPSGNDPREEDVGTPGSYNGRCNTLPDTAGFFTNNWTVSAYVRPFEERERHPIMSKQRDGERGVLLELSDGEVVAEFWEEGASAGVLLDSGVQAPVNEWTHVAFRYDNGTVSLWVNGEEKETKTGVAPVASNGQNIDLGCYEWQEDKKWYMNGQLQDVNIVNSAVEVVPGDAPSPELPPPPDPIYEEFPGETEVFDGSTTCIELDDAADIFAGNWTAEFQFRIGQAQERQPIFSDSQDGTRGRGLLFSIEESESDPAVKEPVLELFPSDDTGTKKEIIGDINIPVGEWVHAAVSYNSGNVRIYIDGQLVADESDIPPVQNPNSAALRIGCYIFNSEFSWYFAGEMSNARFYAEATNVQVPGTTPIPPAEAASPAPAGYERGRVKVVSGNVVADNDFALRGEHVVFANGISPGEENSNGWSQELMYDKKHWRVIRDDYHLNTVRLMMSRPPQNWGGGPGNECSPPGYRCYSLDYVHPNGKTTIEIMDDIVRIAADLGMYIIIDYHPVLGHDKGDARLWWSRIAPRYKDHTHVLYELINEPAASPSYAGDLVDFEQELYVQVRTAAPDTHITAWSFANTRTDISVPVKQATGIDYANASVGFHPYEWDEGAVLQGHKTNITALQATHAVISTEIGDQRKERVRDMEELGISWIGLDNIRGVYAVDEEADYSDVHFVEDVFWPADPDAVDKVADPTPQNQPPVLGTLDDQTSLQGAPISLQIPAQDPDANAILIYTADGLPDGLSLDPNTGLITGHVMGAVGSYIVAVSVTDGQETINGAFRWIVNQGPMYLPIVTR